jgi:acetylglutamate kinase
VGLGPDHDWLNVNADDAAVGVARVLDADHLTLLTDVDAVLDHAGRPLHDLGERDARALIDAGAITGGMAVKVRAALEASHAIDAPVTIASWRSLIDPATPGTTLTAAPTQAA